MPEVQRQDGGDMTKKFTLWDAFLWTGFAATACIVVALMSPVILAWYLMNKVTLGEYEERYNDGF